MRYFRIMKGCGAHRVGSRDYKAGEVVASEADLAKIFSFKFEEVEMIQGVATVSAKKPQVPLPPGNVPEQPTASSPSEEVPMGKDVTEKFKVAQEQSFKVYAGQGGLNVYDEEDLKDGIQRPLNKEPLTRKGVNSFVEQYLKQGL